MKSLPIYNNKEYLGSKEITDAQWKNIGYIECINIRDMSLLALLENEYKIEFSIIRKIAAPFIIKEIQKNR